MTTIAANRDEVYGDLQFTNGTYKWKGSGKVFRFNPHPRTWHCKFIVGFAGLADEMMDGVYYYTNPDHFKVPPRNRELSGIVLTEEHELFRFSNLGKWHKVESPFAATGSGMEHALGAMAAGASPKEAVKIASQHDIYTGMGVKGYRI